ncbi:MAG: hypothetical protein U1F61_02555 [Opitutaceae bacterium]
MSLLRPILTALVVLLFLPGTPGLHAGTAAVSQLARPGPDGKLIYAATSPEGDTLLDFSHCGYGGGGVELPKAAVKVRLEPLAQGNDTARIQTALDEVGRLPRGADGLRGAVLLARGTYRISGTLTLAVSGVVLRGEGQTTDGTVLIATGTERRNLIEVKGTSAARVAEGRRPRITDSRVPVGARSFQVDRTDGLRVGDTVFVRRVGNAAWISYIKMDAIPPRPGPKNTTRQWSPFDLLFDRVITRIDGNRVTVDAPIACAIEERWGGGDVQVYTDPGRVEQVGVESLRGVSAFNRSVKASNREAPDYFADEDHAQFLVNFDHAKNGWARDLTAVHFYHGAAKIETGAKWITVQDSTSLDPVSKIEGGRRYPFAINGQLSLVLRCDSDGARHAYVVGSRVPGPNAFVDGRSTREFATSEPHHRWSVGGLYDNIHSDICFQDRQWMGSGHGWAGANYVAWNTRGTLVCQKPPGAQNFAIGHVGEKEPGAHPREDGYWESHGRPVEPASLYFQQLQDRLGHEVRPGIRSASR